MMSEQSVGSAGRGSAGRDLSQRGSAGRPARPALAVRDEDTMYMYMKVVIDTPAWGGVHGTKMVSYLFWDVVGPFWVAQWTDLSK